MKKVFKRILSALLAVIMLVGIAPLTGIDFKAEAYIDYSENSMLKHFEESQGISEDSIVEYRYDDFDNDSKYEMFVLVGYDEDNFALAELYFVNDTETELINEYEYYTEVEYKYLNVYTICSKKFIMLDREYGNGYITDVYTVINGSFLKTNITNLGYGIKRKFDENTLTVSMTCFDGHTDFNGNMTLRTEKDYYFYWDESKSLFIEYGGVAVTREQVSKVGGMTAFFQKMDDLNYKIQNILYRENGILDINCKIKNDNGYDNENINLKYNYQTKSFELLNVNEWKEAELLKSSFGGNYDKNITANVTYPKGFLSVKEWYMINEGNNQKLYQEVLNQYTGLWNLHQKENKEKIWYFRFSSAEYGYCNEFVCYSVRDGMEYSKDYKIYYSFCDLDDNGIDELIVCSRSDDLNAVYGNENGSVANAIYTYSNGKVYLLAEASYRSEMRIHKSGIISIAGSGGAEDHGWRFYYISTDGKTLDTLCDVSHIGENYYKDDVIISYKEFDNAFKKYTGVGYDNYLKSEVMDLNWNKIPIVESILTFADDPALCVEDGKSINLRFAMTKDGGNTLYEGWGKPAVTVGDKTVISVSNMTEENSVYSVNIKGLKIGQSTLVVTDTKTGTSVSLLITVRDKYTKTYTYAIDKMKEFYPDNIFEKNIKTNIYNQHGIYVNNYSAKYNSNTGGYTVSFDAYNSQYVTGAVDIFDKDGNWLGSKKIKQKSSISSIKDTANKGFHLITDPITGKMFTYEQDSFSEKTENILFEVPKGGYFTISNNFAQSFGTFLYNSSDILLDGLKSVIGGAKDDKDIDVAELVKEKVEENETLKEEMTELVDKTLSKIINKQTGNYVDLSIEQKCMSISDALLNVLKALDIDYKTAFSVALGVSESKLLKAFGPAGTVLNSCFAFAESTDMVVRVEELAKSINAEYTTVVSSLDNGYVNENGISVITNGNIDKEAVLQTFRVSSSDVVEPILNPQNPYEQYELYNICFVKDDKCVQPNGKVTVKIPAPENMNGNSCKIYRREQNGKWTVLQAYRSGDYLWFETDHFSFYALVYDKIEPEIVKMPNKTDYVNGDSIDLDGMVLKLNGKEIKSGFMCKENLAYKVGKQSVTVLYGDSELTFDINVKKSYINSVSLADLTLNYKKSANLSPEISADEGAKYTVKYESSNPKVAAVDKNGKVTALKKGSAKITCTVTDSNGNTVSDTCNVTVKYSFGQWLIKILLFGWIWY